MTDDEAKAHVQKLARMDQSRGLIRPQTEHLTVSRIRRAFLAATEAGDLDITQAIARLGARDAASVYWHATAGEQAS